MDEPTPAHDVTSSRDKRSNEFWLALASSAVALVVGVAAVGSSWFTAHQHDMRPKDGSALLQQKDAFVGFINSASDLAIAIQLQVKTIENRYPYFLHSPLAGSTSDLQPNFADFGHALNLAQLFGSAKVRDQSNKVFDAAAQSRSVIVGWDLVHPADGPANAPCSELLAFENTAESNRQQLGNAIDRFNDAARDDLGLPTLPPTSTPPEPLLPKDACANYPH